MVNFKYKDRLFTWLFGKKENAEWILSLYNAVNGTAYTDASEIEIATIDDAVYMGMKNDATILLRSSVSLWAHQSSINPNMPVRELMYLGKFYDRFIHLQKANIYGRKLVHLPVPKIVVFYNGVEGSEDETVLRLSDAFVVEGKEIEPDVEVKVRMINVNFGHNKELMAACKPLSEYAWFVQRIRDHLKDHEIEEAIDLAIKEMPKDFVIRDFLIGNKAEVRDMCITEYNETETMQMFWEEGKEEGLKEGKEAGLKEGLLEKAMQVYENCVARGMSEEDALAISGLEDAQMQCEAE